MEATTMIYSLFGLVLGLGIAGILNGFADAWRVEAGVGRLHAEIRIGLLVPLLGLLVIMDQTQFYITAYEMRDAIPFSYFSLLCVLGVIGTYFLCSTFVFPDNPADWPDFDDYYMRVRRIVVGGTYQWKSPEQLEFEAAAPTTGIDFRTRWDAKDGP